MVAPRVSLLLPCRDAARFLPECIESLRAQTYEDFEVCAVDNGSNDETGGLLDAWALRDARVRVLRAGRSGLVPALRAAAEAACGTLLARMDADDIADPTRIERQVAWLAQHPSAAACGTGVAYFPPAAVRDGARRYASWLNSLNAPADLRRNVFVECPIAHPTLMIRRIDYDLAGGYADRGWPEDYDLILRLFAAGRALGNVSGALHWWRERPDRTSRVEPRYGPDAFRRCKVHYLRQTLLRDGRAVTVWGAGRVGKLFARELIAQGVSLRAFVDIDPRKVGQTVYDVPVVTIDDAALAEGACVLAAVGSPGAREEIRGQLVRAGFVEMRDFCAVA